MYKTIRHKYLEKQKEFKSRAETLHLSYHKFDKKNK